MNFNMYEYQNDVHQPTDVVVENNKENKVFEESGIDWNELNMKVFDKIYDILEHYRKYVIQLDNVSVSHILSNSKIDTSCKYNMHVYNMSKEISDYVSEIYETYEKIIINKFENFENFYNMEEGEDGFYFFNEYNCDFNMIYSNIYRRAFVRRID